MKQRAMRAYKDHVMQEIAGVGYINDDRQHCMVSVREPSLMTCGKFGCEKSGVVQVVMEIECARNLMEELNTFLRDHDQAAFFSAVR